MYKLHFYKNFACALHELATIISLLIGYLLIVP